MQIFRGALLAFEVIVMITSFTLLGLIESHAVFSIYPLLVAALSGPVLKEYVGWKRWTAIFIGFVFAIVSLAVGLGYFIAKLFHGSGFDELVEQVRSQFTRVNLFKPKSSRSDSSEVFLVATAKRD